MTNNLYPPPRPQSVGEILDTAFRIFRATVVKCLLFATVSLVAGQLANVYSLLKGRPLEGLVAEHDPAWWLLALGGGVISLMLSGAIVRRQYALVSGRPSVLGEELATALRLVPGLFAVSLLLGFAIAACLLPALLVFVFAAGAAHFGANSATALAAMAALILLVPASYVGVRLSSAVTAYLLTDRGVIASLSYSWYLTQGSVWRLSLVYSVGIALMLVFYLLAGVVAAAVAVPFALGDVALVTAVTAAVAVILGSIARPFYTALALAVFGDLSVRKEGTDLAERIASPG
jgi:hypothetical protein